MKTRNRHRRHRVTTFPLCIGHLAGLLALQLFFVLVFISFYAAAIPLVIFVTTALAAPFCSRLQFYLPVYHRGDRRQHAVGLTFDDGPDPLTTPFLLGRLKRYGYSATFFVTGEKARRYPQLVKDILANGHEIGNHSDTHDTMVMLKGPRALEKQIVGCNEKLADFGIRPLAFRPPVGITNPHLFRILVKHGMFCAGFSCRAADFGNRRLTNLSDVMLRKMKPGDILLLHETIPGGSADRLLWEKEVEKIFAGIRRREWGAQAMSQVLRKPVMTCFVNDAEVDGHVAGFYDALAPHYDREQGSGGQRALREQEKERVLKAISTWVGHGSQVLEIGAGTGRFTLPLARSAAAVTAVDTSREMLSVLERKAAHAGIVNITNVHDDIRNVTGYSRLDAVFAVSCLEYVPDLAELFVDIRRMLKPGGILYLTIARRSLIRLTIQVGNALRQGVWLHAWSRREIARFLTSAGFGDTAIRTFGLRSPLCRGILMEVTARRPGEDGAPRKK